VSALHSLGAPETADDAATTARGLYERHGQRVLTFCLSRLRNLQEAQDATQTTFLHVLRALDRGQRPRSEVAWLLGIANNVCRSTQRTLYRRNARTKYAEIDELEAAAEAMGSDSEDLIWLRGALERLPENQRKAILLREWQGLSYADMAGELGLSIPAIEALLFRARRSLAAERAGPRPARAAVDVTSLVLGIRAIRKGAAAKAAAVGVGVTLAATPFVVAGVAARRLQPARQLRAAAAPARTVASEARRPARRGSARPRTRPRAVRAARTVTAVSSPASAVVPRPEQQPPQSQPPGSVQLPPVPPLPPLPPVVREVLAQVPALPRAVQAVASLPPVGG